MTKAAGSAYLEGWGKRTLDAVAALIALVLLAPLMLVAALIIKLDSKGPALISQSRIGIHGRSFRMYKLRTMRLDVEHRSAGPAHSVKDDPRVTRVGRFLRKTSIDELPNLINVLRGDMSLVGPRPALPYEVAHYSAEQSRRLSCKPGITGYWQVQSTQATSFDDMVRLDLRYADEASLVVDLRLLFQTVVIVLTAEAAK